MNRILPIILPFLAAALAFAQTQPAPLTQRDLNVARLGSSEKLKQAVAVPRGYAVVIGVSDYQKLAPDQDLPFAERDAESIYQVLISKEGGNIEFQNVRKLLGKEATAARIRQTLEEWLPSVATEADRVVVYFVGHGLVDDKRAGYLAPYDVDPAALAATAYPMARLSDTLANKVKARWKVLLTDACHSGKVTPASTFESVNDAFRQLPRGFLTLNSSRESERSYEDPALGGGHGVFSYFLARAWMGYADDDPADGVVTADEMVNYVRREVRKYTRDRGESQTPTDHGDFPNDLILGFDPGRRQKLQQASIELANGTLVVEANQEGVEVYVDDMRIGVAGPSQPLRMPGVSSGTHTVRGVHANYEPVSLEVNMVPGATQTVTLRLQYKRTVKPKAQALYDDARKIWDRSGASQQDLSRASKLLEDALRDDSRFSGAALLQCRVLAALGNSQGALEQCKRAVKLDESAVEGRVMLGVMLLQSGDAAEAVRELQRASTQSPKDPFVPSVLAEALIQVDRHADAEKAASDAIQRDPSFAQGHLMRGEARLQLGNQDGALQDYLESLRLSEFRSGGLRTFAFYAIGHGMTKHRSGRAALHRSQKAVAYFGLCSCEFARKNFLRAIGYCQQASREDQSDADTQILIGQNYLELFNRDNRREYLGSAKQSLEAALRIEPQHERQGELKKQLVQIRELMPLVR
ncbi:MAG: caspase family protein [Bryobacteraceae bacterium]